jgi:hypothetical protein
MQPEKVIPLSQPFPVDETPWEDTKPKGAVICLFTGKKLSIAELAKECHLEYRDGKVGW